MKVIIAHVKFVSDKVKSFREICLSVIAENFNIRKSEPEPEPKILKCRSREPEPEPKFFEWRSREPEPEPKISKLEIRSRSRYLSRLEPEPESEPVKNCGGSAALI